MARYDNELSKCSEAQMAGIPSSYQPPTLRQQLEQKKQAFEAALAKVNAAIEALDTNPTLETFNNTILAAQNL